MKLSLQLAIVLGFISGSSFAHSDLSSLFVVEWAEYSDASGESGTVVRGIGHDSPIINTSHWWIESPAGNRVAASCTSEVTKERSWRTSCSIEEDVSGFRFQYVVTRGVDVDVLPFSAGQSLAETDGVFERMMQNPELTSERIELGSFVVEYTAKDALEASGDQPTLIYGMSQLKSSGFETARVQAEVFEALSFALQANCVARGENQAKGDGLCTLMINSGLLKSAPPATVPRYKVLRLEDWGEARNAGGKPEHIERLLDWGRSRLADPN